jgi:hypothetical protein
MQKTAAQSKLTPAQRYYRKHRAEIIEKIKGRHRKGGPDYEKHLKAQREYYWRHRNEVVERRKEFYRKNAARMSRNAAVFKGHVRRATRAYLGNKCACCGETEQEFLSVDHVRNNGAKHRREKGREAWMWEVWKAIKEKRIVTEYQLMCFNCNFSKHFGKGVCAHKRRAAKEAE